MNAKRKKAVRSQDAIDVSETEYLYIQESQIPKSGNGLRTAIDIYEDEVIAVFSGEILTTKQAKMRALRGQDQYFINMPNGSILDSAKVDCMAKYANDAKGSSANIFRNNAMITLDEMQNVCITATRKIKSGEEIFCSYGKRYWKRHGV